jgi:uncharacterized glyoxalase superfamily protein PhnB
MSSVPFKPEHTPQLTPCLTVEEPEKAISFYELVFGFEKIGEPLVRNGLVIFSEMYCLESRIMLQRQGSFSSASQSPKQTGQQQGMGIYLYVPDIIIHYERAKECGAEMLSELIDTFWGDRIYTTKDLDGYIWTFAQRVGEPEITEENIKNSQFLREDDIVDDIVS